MKQGILYLAINDINYLRDVYIDEYKKRIIISPDRSTYRTALS